MVEPLLPCQIRCILASQTQTLRQRVLRPDLASVPYRGDQLPTTAHFGAFVDGTLVGVVSAFYEPLLIPIAPAGTLRAAAFGAPPDDVNAKSPGEPEIKLTSKMEDESPCKATDDPEPTEGSRPKDDDVERSQGTPTETRQDTKAGTVSDSKLGLTSSPCSCQNPAGSEPSGKEDAKPELDAELQPQEFHADKTNSRRDSGLERTEDAVSNNTKPEAKRNGQARPEPGAAAFRLASASNSWRIRGLAVDLPVRGRGLGSRLIATCIDHARKQDGTCVWCVARCSAEPVYEKMGFQRAGDVFYLEGIGPVRYMIRALI
ncbi:unnamed protein product [Ixodes hexagonus]